MSNVSITQDVTIVSHSATLKYELQFEWNGENIKIDETKICVIFERDWNSR
jgi:hypothetical protein